MSSTSCAKASAERDYRFHARFAFHETTASAQSRETMKMVPEQNLHDVHGIAYGPRISLSIRRIHAYFLVALLAGFLSKAGTMYPSFSPDDYALSFPGQAVTDLFIGQGRGLAALMMLAFQAFGLTFTTTQLPLLFISLAAVAWFVAVAVNAVAGNRTPFPLAAACAALIAAHPYLSSYYLFKMSIINHVLVYALAAAALTLLVDVSKSNSKRVTYSAIIVAIGCNANQMTLLLYVVCGAAWALTIICRQFEEAHHWRWRNFHAGLLFLASAFAALVMYVLISGAIKQFTGVASVREYSPHLGNSLAAMAHTLWALGSGTLIGHEAIFPLPLKWLCLGMGLLAVAITPLRQWRWVTAAMLFLVGGIVVSVIPMVVSWGTFVPRIFSALGPVLGLTFLLLAHGWRPGRHRIFAGGLFALASVFAMLSGTMFYQQKLMTDWDQFLARSIYSDVRTSGWLGPNVTIHVAAAWPYHGKEVIGGSGINESAFNAPWTYENLFLVATGESVHVTHSPPTVCVGHPRWPNAGYVFRGANGDIYACMR
jgi:MFS family permease